jgi:hypothetical protein
MRRSLRVYGLLLLSCAAALAQRSTFYWLADAGGLSAAGHTGFRAGLVGGRRRALTAG